VQWRWHPATEALPLYSYRHWLLREAAVLARAKIPVILQIELLNRNFMTARRVEATGVICEVFDGTGKSHGKVLHPFPEPRKD
jgi:hypothetical protein